MKNILSYDGDVRWYPQVFHPAQCQRLMKALMDEIDWQQDEVIMFGKRITVKRLVGWYGEQPYRYIYSGVEKVAHPWTDALAEIKKVVEAKSEATYNSCLLNYYRDGSESMGWHSDDEKTLVPNAAIASVSFGAERRFVFRHKRSKDKVETLLTDGSLLLMKGRTQQCWHHTLPVMRKVKAPRVNLTFRTMRDQSS